MGSYSKEQEFLGALMVVVTSEGLVRVDDSEGRSASDDCKGDSNKYEDFSHGRILSEKYLQLYHTLAKGCDGIDKKLRGKFNCRPWIWFQRPNAFVV
jgi:hypothetical protein